MSPSTSEDIVRRATAAFNAGQPDEAEKLCEKGLKQSPGDPMLSHLLAAVLFSKGESAAARAPIEASLKRRPDNAAALLLAARIFRGISDFEEALKHLDRAIALAPQREMFVEKARTLDQAGFAPQAREAWRAILESFRSIRRPPPARPAGVGRRRSRRSCEPARTRRKRRRAGLGLVRSWSGAAGSARSCWVGCGLSQGDRDQARSC